MQPPPPSAPRAPLTTAEQEIAYTTILLQARGWLVSDAAIIDGEMRLIARKPSPETPLDTDTLRDAG